MEKLTLFRNKISKWYFVFAKSREIEHEIGWLREMAQWLEALANLPVAPGAIPNTHRVTY